MARTGDDGYILFGNTVYLVKIIGNNQVLVRNDTFDSSDNELVLYFGFQLFQVAFQIRRGGNKYQSIRFLYHLINIWWKVDVLYIKAHTCQISRIMSQTLEFFDSVVAAHIPVDWVSLSQDYFCNSRGPAATTHYRYFTGQFHAYYLWWIIDNWNNSQFLILNSQFSQSIRQLRPP